MHPSILGAGVAALLTALPPADAACPAPQSAVQEVFIAADCASCWSAPVAPAVPQPGPPGWRLDWISPSTADAPLAAAALPEAAERAARAGSRSAAPVAAASSASATSSTPVTSATSVSPVMPPLSAVAVRPSAMRLQVVAGPAWNGYFGLQMTLQPARAGSNRAGLPAGSTAWLALVELLSAGTDGSPGPRALVRSVAGPLPVNGLADTPSPKQSLSHLRALRWPEGARPERLQARAWIEAPSGQVLLMAADRCP